MAHVQSLTAHPSTFNYGFRLARASPTTSNISNWSAAGAHARPNVPLQATWILRHIGRLCQIEK